MLADPTAQAMNHTQWMYELQGLAQQDERNYKDTEILIKIARNTAIDLLGLNMMPVEEITTDKATGEEIVRLRQPKESEIIPLSVLTGNEGMVSEILKKHQEIREQEDLDTKLLEETSSGSGGPTLEDLEELEQAYEDDLEFIENDPLAWASAQDRYTIEQMVKPLEDSEGKKPVKKSKVRLT